MAKVLLTESELEKLIKSIIDNLFKKGESKKKIGDILKIQFPKIFKSGKIKIPNEKEDEPAKEDEPSKEDEKEDDDVDLSVSSVNSKWMDITKKVIDKLEGGYWNGGTTKNINTAKLGICGNHPSGSMGVSTETLFGLDRYNGAIESTEDGRKFFDFIDKQKKKKGMKNFCSEWKWGYRGGENEDKLETLAAKIMKNYFDKNMSVFVNSQKLKNKILNNDALLFHMSYATWNGPLYFKNFAASLQKGLNSGKNTKQLIDLAISDRRNLGIGRQQPVIDEIEKLR
jgi:hypothetical protein